MEDVRDVLKQFRGQYKKTEAVAGFVELPAGRYQFEVSLPRSGVAVGKDSDGAVRARIKLTAVVAPSAEFEGKGTSKSWTLVTAEGDLNELGVGILKADLELLGNPAAEMDDIPACLEASQGAVVNATLQRKTDDTGVERSNIYFNSLAVPAASAGGSKKGSKKY